MNPAAKVSILLLVISLAVGIDQVHGADPAIKNVLLIVSDDLRASALGCYGDRFCSSPNIDALAKRGLVFDRAYCQGTSCGPSRRSFMFSRYRDEGKINLGQHFRQSGWYTSRVGKIFHMRVPGDIIAGSNGEDYASAWTERFNSSGLEAHTPGDYACLNLNVFTASLEGRQSTKMSHRSFVSVQFDGDGSDQPDHKSATKAIEILQQHKDKPFFLAVGLVRPHYPMVAPRQCFDLYPWEQMQMPPQQTGDLDDIPAVGRARTISATDPIGKYPENQKRMWGAYYAAITFMDRQVGRVIDELDRLGLTETTAVVLTSDHGYHLGDHGFWQKSTLHEQILRVPLIVMLPSPASEASDQRQWARGRSDSIVELTDLFPTLSELAGLEVPREVQGKSILPILRDANQQVRDSALSVGQGFSLRTSDWHYIRYNRTTAELYDMRKDPGQFKNLFHDPQHQPLVAALNQQLDQRLSQAKLQ